ncbi:hypothetical protein [Streptomyces lunalinharesii]|uniref:Uncharacterized protein n=1 Tax=Streptomyces lunalinharesii TaxID=333384 RepID=A0ABP6EI55_9ACTN
MPVDVFAALSALVRAEARRNAPRPQPHPPTPSAPTDQPKPPGPAAPVPPQHATGPAGPHHEPAPTPLAAASPSSSEAEPSAAGSPRPGLLRKLLALVAAFVRRRRGGSTERRPAPES